MAQANTHSHTVVIGRRRPAPGGMFTRAAEDRIKPSVAKRVAVVNPLDTLSHPR
jgi:hypothetical protein